MKTASNWWAIEPDLTLEKRPRPFSDWCLLPSTLLLFLTIFQFSFACVENSSALIGHVGRHNMIHHRWWSNIWSYLGIPCHKLSHTKSDSPVSTFSWLELVHPALQQLLTSIALHLHRPLLSRAISFSILLGIQLHSLTTTIMLETSTRGLLNCPKMPGPLSQGCQLSTT